MVAYLLKHKDFTFNHYYNTYLNAGQYHTTAIQR